MTRRIACLLALLGGAGPVAAQSVPLAIAPTTVAIADGRRSTVVEVENQGRTPVDLQFRAYGWTQVDGRDDLAATDEVVVSPAIARVAPGAKQLFRVLATTPADPARERAYRLRLNQLPVGGGDGVGINLEFLLPLFVGASGQAPRLSFVTRGDGQVRVANDGARHVKVRDLAPAGGAATPPPGGPAYILAGASRLWRVGPAQVAAGTRLVARTDTGNLDVDPTTLVAAR